MRKRIKMWPEYYSKHREITKKYAVPVLYTVLYSVLVQSTGKQFRRIRTFLLDYKFVDKIRIRKLLNHTNSIFWFFYIQRFFIPVSQENYYRLTQNSRIRVILNGWIWMRMYGSESWPVPGLLVGAQVKPADEELPQPVPVILKTRHWT